MRKLKALSFALVSLAIAVHLVVAACMPCCCTPAGKSAHRCCQVAVKQVRPAQHACCAQAPDSEKIIRTGCCCVKSVPATVEFRDRTTAKRILDQHWVADANHPAISAVHAPTFGGVPPSSRSTVAGPALRVLYCIWLI
jgi:hypothetical protein